MKNTTIAAIVVAMLVGRIASTEEGSASSASNSSNSSNSSTVSVSSSPEGYWKTIDDETNKAKSIVYIWKKNGKLYGKIQKLFLEPNEDPNPVCDKCEGSLKGKPVIGMRILWDMVQDGTEWTDGRIMDPESGNTYSCTMEVQDNGKTLKVRGYMGVSLLGRTQVWQRAQ